MEWLNGQAERSVMFARKSCRLVSVSTATMGCARTARGAASGVGSVCANCVLVKTMLGPAAAYVLGAQSMWESDDVRLGARRHGNLENARGLVTSTVGNAVGNNWA